MFGAKQRAFTLVEVLITSGLVLVLGLAAYSSLAGGLRIWQRANTSYAGEDINIFFEKIAVEVRNSFTYQGIDFKGGPDSLKFATIISTLSPQAGLDRGVGEVAYSFDAAAGTIVKHKRNLSDIFLEEEPEGQIMLKGVRECAFFYYAFDPVKEQYLWLEQWNDNDFRPIAVSIKLKLEQANEIYEFSRALRILVRQ